MSKMSRQGRILLCVFAVLLQWQPWSVASATDLVPPKGYSVGFTATTVDGVQTYVCSDGEWIKRGSSADMTAADGTSLGTYWSVYNKETRAIDYFWSIRNSDGTRIESGYPISGLQASVLRSFVAATSAVSQYLAIIKIHRYAGDAAQVAFVALTGTQGGLPPREELCSSPTATADVPFAGNFTFYNQDRQPPANLPQSLTPKANFVQVVFLEGKVMYKFTKSGQWLYRGISATIRDVAGGNNLGKFGTVKKPDASGSKLLLQFTDPNGFFLLGQKVARPIQMSADGFGWQLLKVTTSGGFVSPVGKFTYVLIGGTMGGLAPRIAGRTFGMTWGSPFTAQCYLYT
ncbi:hypothetical protein KC19_4G042500 [Ceratodon purpureus]|uniref:Uncharacterized protein n=2 Tax=Ceratodon purpureus TaxID=3225 RepID=A0A8T0I879_CERPU|nr:hypothetical protein KC19_4G042500 [Ceratodon purpureus]KAG0578688.1 hypothetical protein KC19_4G042500 [Ceratodon purpureus]KAG0578690.1 hypothetical protein KC19_4G042500 [Ceratodon purpureus]